MSKKDRKTVNKKCICRYEGCCYVPVKECPIHGDIAEKWEQGTNYWEEEFEDEMNIGESTEGFLFPYIHNEIKFINIFEKYCEIICNGSPMKVKIKARKGKIVIERMN